MYIPPNWLHHVEALDPCISVNFWSGSLQQQAYDDAIKQTVSSLVHGWTHKQKRSMLLDYILYTSFLPLHFLHSSLLPPHSPSHMSFITHNPYTRFFVLSYLIPSRRCYPSSVSPQHTFCATRYGCPSSLNQLNSSYLSPWR